MGVIDFSVIDKGEIYSDSSGKSTVTLRLLARCSSPDDSIFVLRRDLSQFQRWQKHPTEPGFYVDQFRAVQRPHTSNWECQVDFVDSIIQDPLSLAATIGEVRSFTVPGATLTDYKGNAILNTAGEPPEPFDFPEQVLAFPISKNVAGLPTWLFKFESCLNADAVRIGATMCDPLTLMIRNVSLSKEEEQGDTTYRVATCELWHRKSKWLELWPSRGFNQRIKIPKGSLIPGGVAEKDSYALRPITVNGDKPTEAQFLDQDGKWIQEPTPGQLWIITTQLYPAINFTNYFPLQ